MPHILITAIFYQWMQKAQIDVSVLRSAVEEMINGHIDTDLGNNIYKKILALPTDGKRENTRSCIVIHKQDHWFFTFGFNKNEKETMARHEYTYCYNLATLFEHYTEAELEKALVSCALMEVHSEES